MANKRLKEITDLVLDEDAIYVADDDAGTSKLASIDIFRGPAGCPITGRIREPNASAQVPPEKFEELAKALRLGDEIRLDYVVRDTAKVVTGLQVPNLSARALSERVDALTLLVRRQLDATGAEHVELKQTMVDLLQVLRRGGGDNPSPILRQVLVAEPPVNNHQ
jgi:hypothetical protein